MKNLLNKLSVKRISIFCGWLANSPLTNILSCKGKNVVKNTALSLAVISMSSLLTYCPSDDGDDGPPVDGTSLTVRLLTRGMNASEDGSQTGTVDVRLSASPESDVTIPITVTGNNGATAADYTITGFDSGLNVTFAANASGTALVKTLTVTATADTETESNESITLGFGPLPAGVTAASPSTATIDLSDSAVAITVSLPATSTNASEDGNQMGMVDVRLNATPTSAVTIPITVTGNGGATAADYGITGFDDAGAMTVTFAANASGAALVKTLTITATLDSETESGESITITFGTLPAGVTAASPSTATIDLSDGAVTITPVTVTFDAASYPVKEGETVDVAVRLNQPPGRVVEIPITATEMGGADTGDYTLSATSVTFAANASGPGLTQTITFTAVAEGADDDGESITLSFGTFPDGVTASTTGNTTTLVNIEDIDGTPALAVTVDFDAADYSVTEGATVDVGVTLTLPDGATALDRNVIIPIQTLSGTATLGDDYTLPNPATVAFTAGSTLTQTFTVTAVDDSADEDDLETITLSFGDVSSVTPGSTSQTVVSIMDNDFSQINVNFGASTYSGVEGGGTAISVDVNLMLAPGETTPERQVIVPITIATGTAESEDYMIAGFDDDDATNKTVTFAADASGTALTKTLTIALPEEAAATDFDEEMFTLTIGSLTAVENVTAVSPNTATVTIRDDDATIVNFEMADYQIAEEATTSASVKVTLEHALEREVIIPITVAGSATLGDDYTSTDFSTSPTNVTFAVSDTEKTITVTAVDDSVDDDSESIDFAFGSALPDGVTAGSQATTVVNILDNDGAAPLAVTIGFDAAAYTATEGGSAVSIMVTVALPGTATALDRDVTIGIGMAPAPVDSDYTITGFDDATAMTFTFANAATDAGLTKTLMFTANEDADSISEMIGLTITGLSPPDSNPGTNATATVTIVDNEDRDGDTIADALDSCPDSLTPMFESVPGNDGDRDGCEDAIEDIDDDNDGLIEIKDKPELNNMRHNLAGSSYRTSGSATGDTSGAPKTATPDCTTNVGTTENPVYLCGYELIAAIDLGTPSTDNCQTTAGDTWQPIEGTFTAVFDGNGNTISDLDICGRANEAHHLGFFERLSNTTVRGLKLTVFGINAGGDTANSRATGNVVGALAAFIEGTTIQAVNITSISTTDGPVRAVLRPDGGRLSSTDKVGGFAGEITSNTTIRGSSVSLRVTGGNKVGGFAGEMGTGKIISSFFTSGSNVISNQDSLGDRIGGLVGEAQSVTIIASYSNASVRGAHDSNDEVGGLVGFSMESRIIASYATGNISGDGGNDKVGGLIGNHSQRTGANAIASYATGIIYGDLFSTFPGEVAFQAGDIVGSLTGSTELSVSMTYIDSYGFGAVNRPALDPPPFRDGNTKPVDAATDLTAASLNGTSWVVTGAPWSFSVGEAPKLRYVSDATSNLFGSAITYTCTPEDFLPIVVTCGTTELEGQDD